MSGIPIYSAFDAGGRDAVATEVQDGCDAHPEITGQYHYHYVATLDFPYLVACYRGTAITEAEGLAIGAPDDLPEGAAPPEGPPPAQP